MQELAGVQAMFFDVFGTVVDWRSGVSRDARAFLGRHAAGADPVEFAEAWRERFFSALEAVRAGHRPYERLDVLNRENLVQLLPEFGVDPASVPAAELDEFSFAWRRIDPWPDSVPGLSRLKRRYALAAVSNGNLRLMLDMARRGGLPWDVILGAEIARTYKPAPEFYRRNAEAMMLEPSAICMVAAHEFDVAAAKEYGMRTVFIPRPSEQEPERKYDPGEWDLVVDDLEALAERLGL